MLISKAIDKIKGSKEYKELLKEHPNIYLAHAFTMVDKIQSDWQIGFYNPDNDQVVVFEVGKTVSMSSHEEVFKKPETKIQKLDLKNVKINLEKAINISEKLVEKKYSAEKINKTIVILQNLECELYNLTLVTHTLHIISIKIDARTGEVLSEAKNSIMSLKKE
ncbi:MAG: hypothetical protein KKB65_03425 [Nanoarchaeota archaeon]|nr:hypothetical protein [Nanoarchaeota archaeon]